MGNTTFYIRKNAWSGFPWDAGRCSTALLVRASSEFWDEHLCLFSDILGVCFFFFNLEICMSNQDQISEVGSCWLGCSCNPAGAAAVLFFCSCIGELCSEVWTATLHPEWGLKLTDSHENKMVNKEGLMSTYSLRQKGCNVTWRPCILYPNWMPPPLFFFFESWVGFVNWFLTSKIFHNKLYEGLEYC